MKKFTLAVLIPLLVLFSAPTSLFANDSMMDSTESSEDSMMMEEDLTDAMTEEDEMTSGENTEVVMEEQGEVDSFELFWPVVAGKTRGESLYFLKRFKEKVRGWLIFGDAKDAEYEVFLATKRVVEAESLIANDEHELARETIDDARENVMEALGEWEDVEGETSVKHELNNKLANLETFLPYLATQTENSELQSEIDELLALIVELDEQV